MGGVSLTQDRRFVVVKMRAPWDGSLVEYTYRNPENLEIGDRAVVDLNHDLVIGEVASYGKKQSRSAYKAAYAMYSPLGIEEWS